MVFFVKSSLKTSFRRKLSKLLQCFHGDCSYMCSKTDTDNFLHLDASKEELRFEFCWLSIGSIRDRTLWTAKRERLGIAYSAREHRSWNGGKKTVRKMNRRQQESMLKDWRCSRFCSFLMLRQFIPYRLGSQLIPQGRSNFTWFNSTETYSVHIVIQPYP